MKHLPSKFLILISYLVGKTVSPGQFKWGTCLLKGNGGVYKVGYFRMETGKIGQSHKPALLQGGYAAQSRKWNLVNRLIFIENEKITR